MSDDSIVELYGDELVAVYNALKEMRLTRSPQGTKYIDEFINRHDVKKAIAIEEEEKHEKNSLARFRTMKAGLHSVVMPQKKKSSGRSLIKYPER
jgi:hypothetical protein